MEIRVSPCCRPQCPKGAPSRGAFWALLLFCVARGACFEVALFSSAAPIEEVRIGVLIRHSNLEEPLNRTLEMLNADTSVLFNTRLTAIVERVHSDSSYETGAIVCRLLRRRVWAIIGPQSIQLTPIVQSMSAAHNIPLVLINWQPVTNHLPVGGGGGGGGGGERVAPGKRQTNYAELQDAELEGERVRHLLNFTINLYPMAEQLGRAYLDLIRYKEWKSFTLVYDTPENFLLVKDIFEASFADTSIHIYKVNLADERATESAATSAKFCNFDETNEEANMSPSLAYKKLAKDLRKRGAENLLLSMSLEKVCKLLREASNVGLLTFYNDYVIANLDTHLLNLTQLQPVLANISGFSILDPEGQQTEFAVSKKWLGKRPSELPRRLISTEYAMLSDAITLVAYSLDELIAETKPEQLAEWAAAASQDEGEEAAAPAAAAAESGGGGGGASEAGCHLERAADWSWPGGAPLMEVFKRTARFGGFTGDLKFDAFGQRADFNLELVLHKNNSFRRAASWSAAEKISEQFRASPLDFGLQAIKNKTLKVSIALTPPYVMYKERHAELAGNERYEGYCIDLLNKLARKLHFKFQLKEVADGQYGKIQNGSWTGMVRELLVGQADLAIVDLTITKERQSAVDFTHPFMTLGIAIMYKKPKLEEAELYSFLMPLSYEVWLSMWSAYVGISLTLWLISRLSPLEWKNPHPCFENADERDLENEIHSIGASLWFTIGSLMQQGSDLAPRSPSVRALASVWYFFTLILISSYTANFAAFLTASRMQSPIESAEDLSKQTRIDYGCKEGGSTQAFFASSNHSTYRRMWNFMESRKHQGVFPKDNDKGISRVKKGNFAFLMESTSIEYIRQRDCELTQIGGLLDHKGYGIALRKRSPFRAPLSKAIVELNEAGELQDLKNRWWSTDESQCDQEVDSALATSELGIDKVGGVFVLLGVGVAIACCTAILEFIWKSMKTPKDQRETITVELWRELVRILKFGPSKRAAAETLYHKSTSQPSETNINDAASSTRTGRNYDARLNGAQTGAQPEQAQANYLASQLYGRQPGLVYAPAGSV